MRQRISGGASVAVGLVLLIVFQVNLGATMEAADRNSTAGNLFEPQIAPVGLAGVALLVLGIVLLLRSRRPVAREQ